jgi:hypothetical protein
VVEEFWGADFGLYNLARIVANEFMKTFDTGEGRPDSAILQAMRSSHVPNEARGYSSGHDSKRGDGLCGSSHVRRQRWQWMMSEGVVGLHVGTDRHVVRFGQVMGRGVHLDGSRPPRTVARGSGRSLQLSAYPTPCFDLRDRAPMVPRAAAPAGRQ